MKKRIGEPRLPYFFLINEIYILNGDLMKKDMSKESAFSPKERIMTLIMHNPEKTFNKRFVSMFFPSMKDDTISKAFSRLYRDRLINRVDVGKYKANGLEIYRWKHNGDMQGYDYGK